MKHLDDFIHKNRDNFDSEEPSDQHFDKFEEKLKKYNKDKNKNNIVYYLKIAAAITIPLFLSILIINFNNYQNTNEVKIESLGDLSHEFKEIEQYYKSDIDSKMKELKHLQCFANEHEKLQIMKDLQEVDKMNKQLLNNLRMNQNNERVINALITNYRTKSELLDIVITQLKENC